MILKVSGTFHTLGPTDGKHVVIQAPINTGSEYINYKSSFSIVLFAVVDANYNFIFVDAGCQGKISDAGVFQDCQLNKRLKSNSLDLPLGSGHMMRYCRMRQNKLRRRRNNILGHTMRCDWMR